MEKDEVIDMEAIRRTMPADLTKRLLETNFSFKQEQQDQNQQSAGDQLEQTAQDSDFESRSKKSPQKDDSAPLGSSDEVSREFEVINLDDQQ